MEDNRYNENVEAQENVEVRHEETLSDELGTDKEETLSRETGAHGDGDDVQKGSEEEDEHSDSNSGQRILGAAGVAGAALVVLTVVITSIVATFSYFKAFGTFVDFKVETTLEYALEEDAQIDLDNFDTGLRIVTFKDGFTDVIELSTANESLTYEVQTLKSDEKSGKLKIIFSGKIAGLLENTRYKSQIIGEKEDGSVKVFDEKSFKTTGPKTEFFGIDSECTCSIDGFFNFSLNYVDENGYYDNFRYELISKDTGKVVASGDIADPTSRQHIDVSKLSGVDFTLAITWDSMAPGDVENGESTITVNTKVKI